MPPTVAELPKKPNTVQPTPETKQRNFQEENEAFLLEHGWEKVAQNEQGNSAWTDAISLNPHKPEKKKQGMIVITKDQPAVPLMQTVGDPHPWTYSMPQAMLVQHQRNQAEKKFGAFLVEHGWKKTGEDDRRISLWTDKDNLHREMERNDAVAFQKEKNEQAILLAEETRKRELAMIKRKTIQ